MSIRALDKSLENLQNASGRLILGRVMHREDAVVKADQLAKVAEEYYRSICRKDMPDLNQALECEAIQYPILYQLTELLGHPALKCEYDLQRGIAKAARILLEVFVIQLANQQAGIDSDEVTRQRDIYQKVSNLLPAKEVTTRFDLRCCKAAIKTLEWQSGVYKELARKHAIATTSGIVMTILSASPQPPYVSPAPIVPAALDLICDIYKHRPKLWYRDIMAIKLCAPEERLINEAQFAKMRPHFSKWFPNNTLASYLCQLFKAVIENPRAEKQLKAQVFDGEEISLVCFASFKPAGRDKYWETRYQALVALSAFIEHDDFGPICKEVITMRMLKAKEHPHVKAIAREAIAGNAAREFRDWQSTFQAVRQKTQLELQEAVPLEQIQKDLSTIQSQIADLVNNLAELGSNRQEEAWDGVVPEDPQQKIQELRNLEKERGEYKEWLLEKDYALKTLQLFEQSKHSR